MHRPKALAANARALAFLFAEGGTTSDHGDVRAEGFTAEDYATVDQLDVNLPAIRAKFDRETGRVRHNGTRTDEHGPTIGFLKAWLWSVCDHEGQLDTPSCEAAMVAVAKRDGRLTLKELRERVAAKDYSLTTFDRALSHLGSAGKLGIGGGQRRGSTTVTYLWALDEVLARGGSKRAPRVLCAKVWP